MLILTRKVGESVLIGDDISITVLSVRGNQVKLGVQAPKEVSVHREEIYQRILQSKDEHMGHLRPTSFMNVLHSIYNLINVFQKIKPIGLQDFK